MNTQTKIKSHNYRLSVRGTVRFLILPLVVILFALSCSEEEEPEITLPPPAPCPDMPVVIHGGIEYPTIQIGSQCWMAKNLNIGQFSHSSNEMSDNGKIEKYCYWNDSVLCEIFGGLYQWDEMMQYSSEEGSQGICPEGWRIPTFDDFDILYGNVNRRVRLLQDNQDFHWKMSTEDSLKASGFAASPAGFYEYEFDEFSNIFKSAQFWSSTLYTKEQNTYLIFRIQLFNSSRVYPYAVPKNAHSVRCVRAD